MANMTIENIGGFMKSGNLESIVDNGRSIQGPMSPQAPEIPGSEVPATEHTAATFGNMLKDSLEKANEVQAQADRAVKELAAGRNKNIHETMLLIEKADMSFRLMMQVRNKVLDAYREVMRMQV